MPYFPRFTTRPFELMAYDRLDDATKDSTTPVVTVTRGMRDESFAPAMDALAGACAGRPAIVGFDPEPKAETSAQEAERNRRRRWERDRKGAAPYREQSDAQLAHHATLRAETASFNAALARLADPVDGGARWLDLAFRFPGVVPVVSLATYEGIRSQVSLANRVERPVAFVCRSDVAADIDAACSAIRGLADPAGSYLVVEASHGRGMVGATVARQSAALDRLRASLGEAFGAMQKVSMAGSFPSSGLRELARVLAIEEREVHQSLNGGWDISYGDHASLPARSARSGGSGFFPHVDLAADRTWRVELSERKSESGGYVECAAEMVGSGDWSRRAECWGSSVVERAAGGGLDIDGVKFTIPGPWVGVRANQHMTLQARR